MCENYNKTLKRNNIIEQQALTRVAHSTQKQKQQVY